MRARDATGKAAGSLRAVSRQRDISGGRAGPRDAVHWEKAPASLPTLSQARTLPWRGKTSLQNELLSRRGSLRGFSLQIRFCTLAEVGAGHCRAPETFPGRCSSARPVCRRARLLRAGAGREPGRSFPAGRWGAESSLPSLLPGAASPSRRRQQLQRSGDNRARNRKQPSEGSRNCPLCCRAGGSAFFPRRGGSCPEPGSSNPSSILGDRRSHCSAAGPGVPWEEGNEEEDNLSHPGQRMFPVPRLGARGRAQSLAQLLGAFPSCMKLLTVRWRLELKV